MAALLPINPADFPDVPTRKALIALDLQNDFLAANGALPVTQPDGMIDRVVALAAAVRECGYGEVIWVRSQFDTARLADEDQLVATETSASLPRSRSASPGPAAGGAAAVDGDAEAFLSVPGDDDDSRRSPPRKPECVRKGTKGADLLPAIAAAKGPRDYAMTKSYYSAFESGQLLNLLRRQFATELIICGSLTNVSVYATALAASSYGLDITIVEDCCGYRSERRHSHAAKRLMEQTGCEFMSAADVMATLVPRSPVLAAAAPPGGLPPRPPAPPLGLTPELIAAAVAGSRSKGICVRPRPSSPPLIPNPLGSAARGKVKKAKDGKAKKEERKQSAPEVPPSPEDLLVSMGKLKLNVDIPEPAAAAATTTTTATLSTTCSGHEAASTLEREDDSPQTWEHVVAWDIRV